jgi:hypothetical protein
VLGHRRLLWRAVSSVTQALPSILHIQQIQQKKTRKNIRSRPRLNIVLSSRQHLRNLLISPEADRRLFFHLRSCEGFLMLELVCELFDFVPELIIKPYLGLGKNPEVLMKRFIINPYLR